MPPINDENAATVTAETDKKSQEDKKKKKKAVGGDGKDEGPEATMSEEDLELKERLETCVSTVSNDSNEEAVTAPIRLKALDVIVTELRGATSSMTSVPKPLKFLRPHYDKLKNLHSSIDSDAVKDNDMLVLRARLADVLAVLAMTMGKHGMFCDLSPGFTILFELRWSLFVNGIIFLCGTSFVL